MKTAVVFGAGRVAAPAIRVLRQRGHRVCVMTDQVDAARELLAHETPAAPLEIFPLDARDEEAVKDAVRRGEIAVSLLPAQLHGPVARACVLERRSFLSTSYVSPEIRALDSDARKSGVLLMNECGLDPGLDHLLAIELVARAKENGETISGFHSICGGIPAPQSNDNPFGYKLSWSTRGVALAGTRAARYLEDGATVECAPGTIFRNPRRRAVAPFGELESYPNGDSLPYAEKYGLGSASTVFRGTFRWPGWCETWSAIAELGWLSETNPLELPTSAELQSRLGPARRPIADRLTWLGLVRNEGSPPRTIAAPLNFLVERMDQRLNFAPGEIDLVVLRDELHVVDAKGKAKTREATIVEYGTPGKDTAMAKLVGVPAGVAASRILEGSIDAVGVHIPVEPKLVRGFLEDLAHTGVVAEFRESAPAASRS